MKKPDVTKRWIIKSKVSIFKLQDKWKSLLIPLILGISVGVGLMGCDMNLNIKSDRFRLQDPNDPQNPEQRFGDREKPNQNTVVTRAGVSHTQNGFKTEIRVVDTVQVQEVGDYKITLVLPNDF